MSDPWSKWLLETRFGGDSTALQKILPQLQEYRDKVLDGAKISPNDTVLDVGCGDGLLGIGALQYTGKVTFSDISRELLDKCRQLAGDRGIYVQTGLPDLPAIPDGSVDVA